MFWNAKRIEIQESEYRPCWVRGRKALIHRWAASAHPVLPHGRTADANARYFQFRNTRALVEFEDGTVERVYPTDVQFADGGRFDEYAWLPMVERERAEAQNEEAD